MDKLHEAICKAVTDARELLASNNVGHHITLEIEISGRVNDGDLKIQYGAGDYGPSVKGDTLRNVVQEHMRRSGWNDRHAPLYLTDRTAVEAAND
jgi:hypothetical protein